MPANDVPDIRNLFTLNGDSMIQYNQSVNDAISNLEAKIKSLEDRIKELENA